MQSLCHVCQAYLKYIQNIILVYWFELVLKIKVHHYYHSISNSDQKMIIKKNEDGEHCLMNYRQESLSAGGIDSSQGTIVDIKVGKDVEAR